MNFHDVDAFLFDLGNVLIEVDFQRAIDHWSNFSAPINALQFNKFLQSHHHMAFEKGHMSPAIFFEHFNNEFNRHISQEQFYAGWNKVLVKEFPGIRDLLLQCRAYVKLFCFSNTNTIHHELWRVKFAALLAPFESIFVSHELGLRKPDEDAFKAVIKRIGVAAQRLVFFDDNWENVASADKIGLRAVHVTHIDIVHKILHELVKR